MGLFGNVDKKNVKKLQAIADLVLAKEDKYANMSDADLVSQTNILKDRLSKGETLDDILPDAFAVCREASWRVLKMKHFNVQVIGGICLHQGRVAEMRTGEGKTLVATLPAYLNALSGDGVHIVTVNDYLARRDAEWMGKLYSFLGLSCGVVYSNMPHEERKKAYMCDITYATNNELGFDYLKDNMVTHKESRVQRPLKFAIVDEVDSILIDEARTPLIISGQGKKSSDLYISVNKFVRKLTENVEFKFDEKEKTIELTEEGSQKAEDFFEIENLGDIENTDLNHHIQQALRANFMMHRDNDYVVRGGEVVIVDEFTGRLMSGRRYSHGLHQAIEAKEGVKIQSENRTLATITFQNYFRLYKKLSGMTGTAKTEEEEFQGIYSLDVVKIPTNLEMQRKDYPDAIYKTYEGKLEAIMEFVEEIAKTGQPILIGTVTVQRSEEISKGLIKKNIKHNVLNAKNHEKEAEIIAQAGRKGAVTIATNMAGRGTDILLGGNPTFMATERMKAKGFSDEQLERVLSYASDFTEEELQIKKTYEQVFEECKAVTDAEKQEVIEVGGLVILGTERHESRRIDDQLRGRSGRQGDIGSSVFYISLEDDLARVFGGEKMRSFMDFFKIPDNMPIQSKMLSGRIEGCQKRLESRNYQSRKTVILYDDVINKQRSMIYSERNKVIDGRDIHEDIIAMFNAIVEEIVEKHYDENVDPEKWDFEAFNNDIESRLLEVGTNFATEKRCVAWEQEKFVEKLLAETIKQYDEKVERYKTELNLNYGEIERAVLLKVVDEKWVEHIDAVDQLRKGVSLRAYASHQDPLVAYKKEAFDMFDELIEDIQKTTAGLLLKLEMNEVPKVEETDVDKLKTNNPNETVQANSPAKSDKTVGRNESCPCGSGKKYKQCCGKNA